MNNIFFAIYYIARATVNRGENTKRETFSDFDMYELPQG
jgi:hypothetical protein